MTEQGYTPTEAQYKGGAEEKYITYDLEQKTRGDKTAKYPKAKRVYIAGDVKDWDVGTFEKKSGRETFGVKIEYEQEREAFERKGYKAKRDDTEYEVKPSKVGEGKSRFTKIAELPEKAKNVAFYEEDVPERYQDALQDIA